MDIKFIERPISIIEAAILIDRSLKYSKAGLIGQEGDLILRDEFRDFRENMEYLYKRAKVRIDRRDGLGKYFFYLRDEDLNFLSNIVLDSGALKLEELDLRKFKKSALVNVYLLEDLEYNEKEIDGFIEGPINLGEIYEVLQSYSISSEVKVKVLDFFIDIEEIHREFLELLGEVIEIYEAEFHKFKGYLEKGIENLRINGENPKKFTDLEISRYIDLSSLNIELEEILFFPSIVNYNGSTVIVPHNKEIRPFASEGILFKELIRESYKEDRGLINFKKSILALGDETRFNIVQLLKNRDYYLKELSETLSLTSPTVSHHMDILVQNKIVKIYTEGRKVYYRLDKESLRALGDEFYKLGGEDEE